MSRRAIRALTAAAVGAAAWGMLVEPRLFTIRRETLPVLRSGAAPVRVLHMSDLHLVPWQHRKIAWVRSLAELRPDLIVLTGDLMGHRFARRPLLHALQPFADAGTPGIFVHGSNDYYGPIAKNPMRYLRSPSRKSTRKPDLDNAALTRGLVALGFTNINNSAARLEVRGTEFEVFGLNDPHISYANAGKMRAAVADLVAGSDGPQTVSSGATPTRLGVVHAPYQSALGDLLDAGAEVIFAGHTHGGQVRVPGLGALTTNCDLPNHLARGTNVWFNAHRSAFLNVSAGLGASLYAPVRFACRPEVSLITLEAAR